MWSILGGDKVFLGKSVESFLHNLADEPTNQQSNAHARKHECIHVPINTQRDVITDVKKQLDYRFALQGHAVDMLL